MTQHDHPQLDAAVQALARQEPPRHHVQRVLARTSAGSPCHLESAVGTGVSLGRRRLDLASYLRPRWLVPIAATAVVAVAATWNAGRSNIALPAVAQGGALGNQPDRITGWGAVQDIDRPVLPPQAYWGMDPFAEFVTLRPAWRGSARGKPAGGSVSEASSRRPVMARNAPGDDELAWVPVPSGLPPIEVASIERAPLHVPSIAPLEEITLAEIPLAPIVIAPFVDEEERP